MIRQAIDLGVGILSLYLLGLILLWKFRKRGFPILAALLFSGCAGMGDFLCAWGEGERVYQNRNDGSYTVVRQGGCK